MRVLPSTTATAPGSASVHPSKSWCRQAPAIPPPSAPGGTRRAASSARKTSAVLSGNALGSFHFSETALDVREQDLLDREGQPFHRRLVEQDAQRDLHVKCGAQPMHDLRQQ